MGASVLLRDKAKGKKNTEFKCFSSEDDSGDEVSD
jgi:hypothetical protein